MNNRLEFIEIFNSVREHAFAEWEAKNDKIPTIKRDPPPTFMDLVNRTIQFAWYIDGYQPPSIINRTEVINKTETSSSETVP